MLVQHDNCFVHIRFCLSRAIVFCVAITFVPFNRVHDETPAMQVAFDWRESGLIRPVQNQGICGSCWAIALSDLLSAAASIRRGRLENLSASQIISCAPYPTFRGCGGGFWLVNDHNPFLQTWNKTDGAVRHGLSQLVSMKLVSDDEAGTFPYAHSILDTVLVKAWIKRRSYQEMDLIFRQLDKLGEAGQRMLDAFYEHVHSLVFRGMSEGIECRSYNCTPPCEEDMPHEFVVSGWKIFPGFAAVGKMCSDVTASDYLAWQSTMIREIHNGPIAVSVLGPRTNPLVYQVYNNEIFTSHRCSCLDTFPSTHMSLLVGYNLSSSPPYWIVKGSYGPSFGMDGFMRFAMEPLTCGLGMGVAFSAGVKDVKELTS